MHTSHTLQLVTKQFLLASLCFCSLQSSNECTCFCGKLIIDFGMISLVNRQMIREFDSANWQLPSIQCVTGGGLGLGEVKRCYCLEASNQHRTKKCAVCTHHY